MFRWTKVPNERLTFLLHDQLSGSFIGKIDLALFVKIFEGGHLEHRPGIKWIDKSKNNTGVKIVWLPNINVVTCGAVWSIHSKGHLFHLLWVHSQPYGSSLIFSVSSSTYF